MSCEIDLLKDSTVVLPCQNGTLEHCVLCWMFHSFLLKTASKEFPILLSSVQYIGVTRNSYTLF